MLVNYLLGFYFVIGLGFVGVYLKDHCKNKDHLDMTDLGNCAILLFLWLPALLYVLFVKND
jgi:hypothetical protein